MKKKMMAVLLLGAVVTFTGCSKQEIHSIDMNSGETEKTQTYQEDNTDYDLAEKDTEQRSYLQETSDSTQSNEISQEVSDSVQSSKTPQETFDNMQSNETSQESSDSAQNKETPQDLYTAFIKMRFQRLLIKIFHRMITKFIIWN